MKTCSICGIEKEDKLFNGRRCLPCRVNIKREYRSTDEGKRRRLIERSKYRSTAKGAEIMRKAKLKNRSAFPNSRKARRILAKNISLGKITRPDNCSECHCLCKPEAHHDDYDHPLDVRFLCKACHVAWHKCNEPLNKA